MKIEEEKARIDNVMYIFGILCMMIGFGIGLSKYIFPGSFPIGTLPCVFYKITGFYCPGCGGTRAIKAFLQGNIIKSLLYYPAVLYIAVLYTIFMVSQTISRMSNKKRKVFSFKKHHIIILIALILCNWIFKNFLVYYYHVDVLKLL